MQSFKPFIYVITGIVIGIAIAFWILRSDIKITKRKVSDTGKLSTLNWNPVPEPNDLNAKNWLENYYKESKKLWYPLETGEDTILQGFYIDKALTDTIYSQSHQMNGFRIYLAKRPGAAKRNYCLVFVGTEPGVNPDDKPVDTGIYYDYVDPCPTNCGTSIDFEPVKKKYKTP